MEKKKLFKKLPNQNHEFLKENYPYTINPGGANHEELVSLIGIYEYMMELYDHHFNESTLLMRKKINKINELISKHEGKNGNPILKFIDENKDLRLIGQNKIEQKNRAPTISFTSSRKSSKK